jgi:hypothetical protein
MPFARSTSSGLGALPFSTTITIPVLNCFCEVSYDGVLGPLAAMTSWIVIFVLSPR